MDENEECGLSWSGHNIKGDRGSILVVKDAIHQAGIVPELKDMIKSLQAERDALRADAARYRWLRENGRMGYIWNAALHEHEKEGRWDVDAVIDAERGAQS